MKRFLLVLFIAVMLGSAIGSAQEVAKGQSAYVPVTKFDPFRDAAKDIEEAVGEARRTGRRVLLDVGGDWCVWCRRLDSLFAGDAELSTLLHDNFVVVKVNWSRENKNETVLARYPKIPGYPHLFVLDSNGELLHSQDTGQLESGKHHDREKVSAFLRKWTPRRGDVQ